jgi:hypothetical protein
LERGSSAAALAMVSLVAIDVDKTFLLTVVDVLIVRVSFVYYLLIPTTRLVLSEERPKDKLYGEVQYENT